MKRINENIALYSHGLKTTSVLFSVFILSLLLTFSPSLVVRQYGVDSAIEAMVIIEFSMALTVYLVYLRKLSEFRFSKFKKIDFILPLSLIIVIQAGYIYFNSKFNGASENLIFDVRSILMLTLIIPFYEEIFYRGCLFGGLCSVFRKRIIIPIIFSSLVFSLMHTQFVSVFEYVLMFVVGVIISYSRVVTKGLLAPIAIHSGMNVFVISIQILS
jgi:hypothetical protein